MKRRAGVSRQEMVIRAAARSIRRLGPLEGSHLTTPSNNSRKTEHRVERRRSSGDVEAGARDTAMISDGQTFRPYVVTRIAMTRPRITCGMISSLSLLLLISPA